MQMAQNLLRGRIHALFTRNAAMAPQGCRKAHQEVEGSSPPDIFRPGLYAAPSSKTCKDERQRPTHDLSDNLASVFLSNRFN
jgi:hypothetical protein